MTRERIQEMLSALEAKGCNYDDFTFAEIADLCRAALASEAYREAVGNWVNAKCDGGCDYQAHDIGMCPKAIAESGLYDAARAANEAKERA